MNWTLEHAQQFLGDLQNQLRPIGWCVGLTGSVLYNTVSQKDIDVILMPMGDGPWKQTTLHELYLKLYDLGFRLVKNAAEVKEEWLRDHNSHDTKHVEIWEYNGRRVDFFFLR